MMKDAGDKVVKRLANDMQDRSLPECFDIRRNIEQQFPPGSWDRRNWLAHVSLICSNIETAIREHPLRNLRPSGDRSISSVCLISGIRDSDTPLNRILIRIGPDYPIDVAEVSPVIAAAETFEIFRAYVLRDDHKALDMVKNKMRTEIERAKNGDSCDPHLVAAAIVRDAGGEIVGRTRFQKVAYLMQLAGLFNNLRFEYHHYGPFSEDIAAGIEIASASGTLTEVERQGGWGGRYSIYTLPQPAQPANPERAIFVQMPST